MNKNLYVSPQEYGYVKLGAAIVYKAVEDYKFADNSDLGLMVKKDVVDFIRSPYFRLLTNIDPEYLLRTLGHDDSIFKKKKKKAHLRNTQSMTELINELAKKYDRHPRTIYRMIDDGRIKIQEVI